MRLRELFYYLNVVFVLSFCSFASGAVAEEKKEDSNPQIKSPKVLPAKEKKEDTSPQIKALQAQQEKLRQDYEVNKKIIQGALQKTLKEYKEGTGSATRQDLIKANQEKQDKLRETFQEELRKLQAQERKLRLGRETLERPLFGGKQVKVYKEAVDDKQKRLDFQRRKEAQDKILRMDQQQEQQHLQPKPSSLKPGFTPPAGSESQSQSTKPTSLPPSTGY